MNKSHENYFYHLFNLLGHRSANFVKRLYQGDCNIAPILIKQIFYKYNKGFNTLF